MTRTTIRRVLAALVIALPATVYTFPEVVADARPECERADEWVLAHASSLPATLDEIADFPELYRKAIIASLTTEQRVEIWKARVSQGLADTSLTASQRAILRRTIDTLTVDLLDNPDMVNESKDTFETALIGTGDATSQKRAMRYFTSVADDVEGRLSYSTAAVWLNNAVQRAGELLALGDCQCSSAYEYCQPFNPLPNQYCCCGSNYPCNYTWMGCGWLYLQDCDGKCSGSSCSY